MEYSLFDNLMDSVVVVNQKRELVYVNEMCANFLELSLRRMKPGKSLFDFINFEDNSFVDEKVLSELQTTSGNRELSWTSKTGKTGRGLCYIHPVPPDQSQNGEWNYILFIRDVLLEETLHKKFKAEFAQKEAAFDELKKAHAQLEDYSKNLEEKVKERTKEISQKNILLRSMLDSLGQGFLIFDEDGNCLPTFSKACETVFEANPVGKSIDQVLKIPEEKKETFSQWKMAIFQEMLPFNDLAVLGPQSFNHSESKHIVIEYHPMRDESGKVQGVVVVGTDATGEYEAKKEAERERAYAQMIIRLVKSKHQFRTFMRDAKKILLELKDIFSSGNRELDLELAYRLVHTLKGGAASFAMTEVTEVSHHCEEKLNSLMKVTSNEYTQAFDSLKNQVDRLENSFHRFLEQNREVIGGQFEDSGRRAEVPVVRLAELVEIISGIHGAQSLYEDFTGDFIKEPIQKQFGHYDQVVQDVAGSQGKNVNPIEFVNGDIRIIPESYSDLFANLVHAFRNAVDHGLEDTEERLQLGKSDSGTIRVCFQEVFNDDKDWLEILIEDDGRGIDPAMLRKKLVAKGLSELADEPDDHKLVQAIFASQFSTRDEVTDTSGRGVGMDAIKDSAERLGGNAEVFSQAGNGTKLVVRVPLHSDLSWAFGLKQDLRKTA